MMKKKEKFMTKKYIQHKGKKKISTNSCEQENKVSKGFQLKAHPSQKEKGGKRKEGENDRKNRPTEDDREDANHLLLLRDFFDEANAENNKCRIKNGIANTRRIVAIFPPENTESVAIRNPYGIAPASPRRIFGGGILKKKCKCRSCKKEKAITISGWATSGGKAQPPKKTPLLPQEAEKENWNTIEPVEEWSQQSKQA